MNEAELIQYYIDKGMTKEQATEKVAQQTIDNIVITAWNNVYGTEIKS